jgi:hypothetical protein
MAKLASGRKKTTIRIDVHLSDGSNTHLGCPDVYCCECDCKVCKAIWHALERPKPDDCPQHGKKDAKS